MSSERHQPSPTVSHQDHKAAAPSAIACLVITCSDTRTAETDASGAAIIALLKSHGHTVSGYHVVKDEPSTIRALIEGAAMDASVQVVIINGGTGISRRDSTFEAVDSLLEKRLDGFGEIFRYLSFQDIGSAAIMSRATAGLYRNRLIISIPGSEKAVRLAMDQLILKELGHMVREMTK